VTDSYVMPIEEGKIREFAMAVKSKNPAHLGANAVIPPTMLTSARLFWEPASLSPMNTVKLDMARVLHGEEEYEFFGPLPKAGDRLTVTTSLGDQYEKEGKRGGTMRFLVILNEFRNESGEVVAVQRTTVVETAKTTGS
jgi:hypothetical protein